MARTRTVIVCGVCVLAAAPAAWGACRFQNDEIVNPFEAGCGDVMLTYTESDNTGNNIALGYPVPIPVDSLTPVDGFRTYDSLFARHQSLLMDHLEVVEGQIVGRTVADRPDREIWAYRLGDIDTTTAEGFAEGAVLVNGGIHAREWQTPEAVTGLMEAMVDGKADGGFGQYLIENLTTVLLPVNNVDGFLQTQRFADRTTADREQPRDGRMRRKNMRNPQTQGPIDEDLATVGDNFWGIDLNRNSVNGFGQGGGSSASETSLIYRGTSPASEPEIAALQAAATLAPAARLRFYSDTHSFGQVYLAPTTGNTRRNSITAQLAARMTGGFDPRLRLRSRSRGVAGDRHDRRLLRLHVRGAELDDGARAGQRRAGLRRLCRRTVTAASCCPTARRRGCARTWRGCICWAFIGRPGRPRRSPRRSEIGTATRSSTRPRGNRPPQPRARSPRRPTLRLCRAETTGSG